MIFDIVSVIFDIMLTCLNAYMPKCLHAYLLTCLHAYAQPWADHKRKINTKAQLTNPTCIYGLYVSVSTDFFLTARVKKVALFLESVKAYCVVVAGLNRNRSRLQPGSTPDLHQLLWSCV